MQLYLIRRRSAWADAAELERAGAASARVGEEIADRLPWIRSYIVTEPDGRLGSVCLYEAPSSPAMLNSPPVPNSASQRWGSVHCS